MTMKVLATVAIVLSLFLTACSENNHYDFAASATAAQQRYDQQNQVAIFDPANGQLPLTNDLLLDPQTGQVNYPLLPTDSASAQSLKSALNTLDGFSTSAPQTAAFSAALDPATVKLAQTIHVYELSSSAGAAVVSRELGAADLAASVNPMDPTTLVLTPLQPLKPATQYAVVLTNGLHTASGYPVVASSVYQAAKGKNSLAGTGFADLEPVRQLVNQLEGLAATQDVASQDIVLSWRFTTQSIGVTLRQLAQSDTAGSIQLAAIPGAKTPLGQADLYAGTLTVPYYLDATAPTSGFWKTAAGSPPTRFNSTVVATANEEIPVLMTVPNQGTAPASGWPIVIFQHGIGQNRTNLLAIGDTLAQAGFVGIAIDLPLHGVTDPTDPVFGAFYMAGKERTFDLDLLNNSTEEPTPDGEIDPSGQYFINPQSLLTSRDNMRQGVADLLVLRDSLAAITGVALNSDDVQFVGYSLGALVGTDYLAVESQVAASALIMPGGGVPQLLNASPTFGPRIRAALAANGVLEGTPEFESFFVAAQQIIDGADPINFGYAAVQARALYVTEVVGGNSSPPDQVIPNTVANAPLSGTEPLLRIMALAPATTSVQSSTPLKVVARFVAGSHSAFLNPAEDAEVTSEMQSELASFLASRGRALQVGNAALLEQTQ